MVPLGAWRVVWSGIRGVTVFVDGRYSRCLSLRRFGGECWISLGRGLLGLLFFDYSLQFWAF